MSVIAEARVPADQFELGRILRSDGTTNLSLESVVPLGGTAVPFVRVREGRKGFERAVGDHPSVESIREIDDRGDQALYAIDWRVDRDLVLEGIQEAGGQILDATAAAGVWEFQLRFPDHGALSGFDTYCENAHIDMEITRVYNPTRPQVGAWYGLTTPQRETLMRAVEAGYYDIPRRVSTEDLAEEFGVSDQAVTERLRRAIATLAENTVLALEDPEP